MYCRSIQILASLLLKRRNRVLKPDESLTDKPKAMMRGEVDLSMQVLTQGLFEG